MTERPTVDVLIVSYNSRDEIADCLESITLHLSRGEGPRVNVRVFDNASSDGSADLVARDFSHVALTCSERNIGFAAANNRLVSDSNADHVMLLNPDTILTEDVISPLLHALESDPRNAVAGPRLTYPDAAPQPSSERLPSLRFELARHFHGTKADRALRPFIDLRSTIDAHRGVGVTPPREPHAVEFLWATCWLMRTVDARQYGPFDERFTTYDEDLDLCRRLSADGRAVIYVPSATLVHVGGASSDPERKRRLMRAGRELYYRRHQGVMAAAAYRAIVGAADIGKLLLSGRRSR